MYSLHKLSKYLEGDEDVGDGNGHDEVDSVVRGVKKRMKFRQAVITVLNRLNSSQYHSTGINSVIALFLALQKNENLFSIYIYFLNFFFQMVLMYKLTLLLHLLQQLVKIGLKELNILELVL